MRAELWHRKGNYEENYEKGGYDYLRGEIAVYFPDAKVVEYYVFIEVVHNVEEDILESERKICELPYGRYTHVYFKKGIYAYPPNKPPYLIDVYDPIREKFASYKYYDTDSGVIPRFLRDNAFHRWCEFNAWWRPGVEREKKFTGSLWVWVPWKGYIH